MMQTDKRSFFNCTDGRSACRLRVAAAACALTGMLAVPGVAVAIPLTFDFSGYRNRTTVDELNIPGVSFVASDPSRVYVYKGTLQIEAGIDGVDLVVRFDDPVTQGWIRTYGLGMCQTGSDVIEWVNRGSVRDSIHTLEPIIGRCDAHAYERGFTFDEMRFDVLAGEQFRLLGGTFDVSAVPAPGVLALLGLGAFGLAGARRRMSARANC